MSIKQTVFKLEDKKYSIIPLVEVDVCLFEVVGVVSFGDSRESTAQLKELL
jgi:hypothetical protein